MSGYDAIPTSNTIEINSNGSNRPKKRALVVAVAAVIVALILFLFVKTTRHKVSSSSSRAASSQDISMPAGVNLASWLSLEDYFFVGESGAVEVATPDTVVAAHCLPPLATTVAWNSETDLLASLVSNTSLAQAILTFHAFRVSFLDWSSELSTLQQMGIQRVRVPISWCLTNHDPSQDEHLVDNTNKTHDRFLWERYTCLDPFFAQEGLPVRWPAVPKPLVVQFLQACAQHGIQATLDIHTYPGGTSLGTFSGVWPRKPLFWKYDQPDSPNDIGRQLFRDFLSWIESLDSTTLQGLGAITPMNEPGHLAGLYGPGSSNPDQPTFVPPIHYDELEQAGVSSTGPHARVLMWQKDAVDMFRSSRLVDKGIELHVNVHESIFVPSLVPTDRHDTGGRHPAATALIGQWWRATTTATERATWAVLDMHHYHAWEPSCQGSVDGSGAYICGDDQATDTVLQQCASWANVFRDAMQDDDAKLISGEFSASTHHSVLKSCIDVTTLRKSYQAQIEAAQKARVDLYWWSWKMPHGGAFRPAWSFKHFLYLMQEQGLPDESVIPCGN